MESIIKMEDEWCSLDARRSAELCRMIRKSGSCFLSRLRVGPWKFLQRREFQRVRQDVRRRVRDAGDLQLHLCFSKAAYSPYLGYSISVAIKLRILSAAPRWSSAPRADCGLMTSACLSS